MKSLILAIACLLLMHSGTGAMDLVSSEIPPYASEKQGEQGIAIDVVKEVFSRACLDLNLTFKPWKRAQHMVLTAPGEEGLLITPLTRTPNRAALYEWIFPILSYNLQMITNDPAIPVHDEAAMKKIKVCVLRSSPAEYKLREQGYARVDTMNSELKCLQLMKYGRLKAALSHGFLMAVHNYRQFGGDPGELIKGLSYPGGTIYLAATKGTVPDEIRSILLASLKEIKQDGTYEAILNRYGR